MESKMEKGRTLNIKDLTKKKRTLNISTKKHSKYSFECK